MLNFLLKSFSIMESYAFGAIFSMIIIFMSGCVLGNDLIINDQMDLHNNKAHNSSTENSSHNYEIYLIVLIPYLNVIATVFMTIIVLIYHLYTLGKIKFNIMDNYK